MDDACKRDVFLNTSEKKVLGVYYFIMEMSMVFYLLVT